MTARYVALLRGINVGGKNRLAMADLTRCCEAAGATGVKTYIQSGNVALDLDPESAGTFAGALTARLREAHGLDVPVVVRPQHALAGVLAGLPWPGADEDLLSVAFLADVPDPARVARLDPERSPPDQFQVVAAEVYLYTPNGLARTKLTNAWLDSQLKTVSTVRNWRTVRTLLDW